MCLRQAYARAKRLSSDERGFQLIELIMVSALLSVVLVATLALLDIGTRMAPKDQERGHMVRESQTGLHRMTRELRQAYAITSAGASSMEADVVTNSGTEHVTYNCNVTHPQDRALRQCVRFGAGGRQEVVIDRITSATFAYTPNAAQAKFAEVRLVVPSRGHLRDGHGHDIVLTDGFYMRNRDVAD